MTQQARVTELMFDEDELARRARTTLAGAESGTLVIAGSADAGCRECPVTVTDDGGEPVLRTSRLDLRTGLWSRREHAALLLQPNEQYGVGLTLVGRISAVSEPGPGLDEISICLSVERVMASCPEAVSYVPGREISLAAYAAAEPDAIAANGWRVARHLTEDHQDQVRALVAHRVGRPVAEVVAVQLSQLSRQQLVFWWVSESGAHSHSVRFDRPARDLVDLGLMIRGLLAGRRP